MMRFQSVTSSALAVPARANKDIKLKATLRRIVPPLSRTHLVFAGIRTWLRCARRKKTQAPVGSKGVLNGGVKPRSTALRMAAIRGGIHISVASSVFQPQSGERIFRRYGGLWLAGN